MANFTYNIDAGISTSDGITINKTVTGAAANAKALLDDTFAGATAIDLAPLVTSITAPRAAILLAGGDGATLKFDGAAAFTTKAYVTMLLELSPSAVTPGLLDIEITTAGTSAQRIRFLCTGDPT
ncbi:MAG TPA: hypothetical protein VMZ50_14160 [Phycisphaerae bacterium]|nr:hypothetical protein [Phycisphaerae bacterium]